MRMRGDAVDALKICAEALHHGNRRLADSQMKRVLDLAEEETDSKTGRLIRYFAEALARRAYGLHPKYLSLPSFEWKFWMCYSYGIYYSVGRTIPSVIKGKSRVHVIELGQPMDICRQWKKLFFSYFGDLGDLRHLRLSLLVQENVEFSKESEEELIRAAKNSHIELEYKIIPVNSLADMDVPLLEIRRGEEFVVVNCMFVLSKMLWEAVALEKVLVAVRDVIKPDIMIVVEHDHDANHNQSDFLLRFDESLKYYSSLYLAEEFPELEVEIELCHKYQICNIVACEGNNRVERHQTLAQWKSLLFHYGFSIYYLPAEFEDENSFMRLENGILVSRSVKEKQPLFFVSGWTVSRRPFKSSGSNEGLCIISSESHPLQTFPIFQEDLYLIRMASLAEIYDILLNISKQYKVPYFLTWAAYLHDESNSPLKLFLCMEDVACLFNYYGLNEMKGFKWQLEEGEGYVGKALKCNRPFYVPDILKSEENVCPYISPFCKHVLYGALAIKFSNAYTNCGNYVVELLFPRYNMTLEKQNQLVDCIIYDLKDARPRFVTYVNQGPPVELAVHDAAVSNTMLIRGNPPSQSTSDFSLNGTNQGVGNAMDLQWPMLQLHYTGVLDAMPTQGNLLAQSTNDFGLKGKPLVVNPMDGNVLQWPHEQGPDANATSHTKASIENLVAPPIGVVNLNGRLSSSGGINQTTGSLAMDMQGRHKQGNKRGRRSKSDVWDHYEKEKVVNGELLAKCNYCDFTTDGSSKKGTSHLWKHLLSRHGIIKNVQKSSNLPSKNLETQSILDEKSMVDRDKIHMDVAKMFIKYKLPLSIIQDEVFKNPFTSLQFELQSENDLGLSILHVYNEEREKLLGYFDKLSCGFNLTINLWEDDAKRIVNCCLTAQFIDDSWALKKKILGFERLKHDFNAASLCEIFKRVLLDWNIKEKTCSLTIHSSLSNVEIVYDGNIWPSGVFYLSYDKCIRDINCMTADISLKSICQAYQEMNHQENRSYTLMNVECSNNWRICKLILAIVAILNPSLKLDFVEFVYKEIYGDATAKEHLDQMSNFLRSLYDKFASNCSNHTTFTTATGDTSFSSLSNAEDKVMDSFRKYKASKQSRPAELRQYLEEDEGSSVEIDILNWWCNNSSRFPTLGKMARDFLAIPLSTIVSSSAFAKEVTKIISDSGDQEPQIINAMICCQDWLETTKTSACDEKCDEKLMREWRAWSKTVLSNYLLWDFTHQDLELLGKWKNAKMTGERVGLDEKYKVQDKFLAPLVMPLVDSIIQGTPQVYYIVDEVVNTYFLLLTKRSEENPKVFLKHISLDSSVGNFLLGGVQPSVPSWINPEEQINACKLFLPLCFSDHWTLFYVDIKDQKFVWLDPRKESEVLMPSNFERILVWFKCLVFPAMGLNNARDWPLVSPGDIPKQQNGIDCGIFIMKYADCLTHANCIGFPFSQEDMPHFRERIFLDIYNGRIHVPQNFVRS